MNEKELLNQILAQQVYLLKRIEDLEHKLGVGGRVYASDQVYYDELVDKSKKIKISRAI